jgi:hypothetical protein
MVLLLAQPSSPLCTLLIRLKFWPSQRCEISGRCQYQNGEALGIDIPPSVRLRADQMIQYHLIKQIAAAAVDGGQRLG